MGFFTGAGPVVQIKDARGNIDGLTVSGKPLYEGQLIVLTNKLSASASEIFAGAMADYGRALIVGDTTTFGKGSVQLPRRVGDYMPLASARQGSGTLKITEQKYYRVGGASTQLKGVPSDIILPMPTAAFEIGEAELDYALPYDEIPKAPGFTTSTKLADILSTLKSRSYKRIKADKDLQYMTDNIARFRDRVEINSLSLNKAEREKESNEQLARKKTRDAERKARYALMAKDDAANMKIYKLTLKNLNDEQLHLDTKDDDSEYMQKEKDLEDELSESPEYPSGLDAELRETLHILRDMIDFS